MKELESGVRMHEGMILPGGSSDQFASRGSGAPGSGPDKGGSNKGGNFIVWMSIGAAVFVVGVGQIVDKAQGAIEAGKQVASGACSAFELPVVCNNSGDPSNITSEIELPVLQGLEKGQDPSRFIGKVATYSVSRHTNSNQTFFGQYKKDSKGKAVSVANIAIEVDVSFDDPVKFGQVFPGQDPDTMSAYDYFYAMCHYPLKDYQPDIEAGLKKDLDKVIKTAQANADDLLPADVAKLVKAGENAYHLGNNNNPAKPDLFVTYDIDPASTKDDKKHPILSCQG